MLELFYPKPKTEEEKAEEEEEPPPPENENSALKYWTRCVAILEKVKILQLVKKVWRIPLFRACVGFFLGMILSLLWFLMMTKQMELSLKISLGVSAALGLFFTIGLAFSTAVRCVVLLMLPSLCSSKGRALLLAFTFILVLNHPMENFKANFQVASDSITCTQSLGHESGSILAEAAMAPSRALLAGISEVMISATKFSKKVQRAIIEVRDLFKEILASITKMFKWMTGMEVNCNEKMGGPYEKCHAAMDKVHANCKKKAGILKFTCGIFKSFKKLCSIARIGELLCMIPQMVKHVAEVYIKDKIVVLFYDMADLFSFNVDIQYSYNITMVQSKSYDEIKRDIRKAITEKFRPLTRLLQVADWIFILLIFLVFIKRKFLTKEAFDNTYLSKLLLVLDQRRECRGKSTIFPMSYRERRKYIRILGFRLTDPEQTKLLTGLFFLMGTLIHASLYLFLDAGLYWILWLIRRLGRITITEEVPSHLKLHVEGDGVLSDVYRSLFTQFDPLDKGDVTMDSASCLPQPITPNWNMYKLIGGLFFLCLILTLIEAYVLRLRHMIAGWFYEDKKKDRAVYLYSHILRRKGPVIQIGKSQESTFMSRLAAKFPSLGKLLKRCGYTFQICRLCGVARKKSKDNGITACENLGCNALYCNECLPELHNLCTSCSLPVDYSLTGDLGDERDSSEEELEQETYTRSGYYAQKQ